MPGLTGHKALNVSLLDISPQNKAVLEFFFAGAGRRLFKVTNNSDADAFIVDFDLPNAKKNWEEINASLNKPTMALAFYETGDNTIWLSKPLTTQALNEAAEKVKKQLSGEIRRPIKSTQKSTATEAIDPTLKNKVPKLPPIEATPNATRLKKKLAPKQPSSTPEKLIKPKKEALVPTPKIDKNIKNETSKKTTTDKPTISLEQKKKRWRQLCGDAENIQKPNTWKDEVTLYTPENYLISSLQNALRLAVQSQQMVRMQYQQTTFYFLPKQAQAYCNISIDSDAFEVICKSPVKKTDVLIHIMDAKEVEQAQAALASSPSKLYDIEGLLWTAMLLTSSGKLHRNIDLKKRVMLRHWPNFTRIETFPYVVRISALWSNEAFNMLEVAHNLQIPQRYVFAYYNAACVLGLMEHSPEKLKSKSQTKTKTPTKNRGLFSRLLQRLTG